MKKPIIILGLIIIAAGVVLVALRLLTPEDTWICDHGQWVKHGNPSSSKPTEACGTSTNTNTSKTNTADVPLVRVDASNKYGWLDGGLSGFDADYIRQSGGGWIRPHPGAAVWDMIERPQVADEQYNFKGMDEEVIYVQKNGLNLLVTIWPFAEWDQLGRSDAASCAVSTHDEFLQDNNKKGRPSYLPLHRCNPNDWTAYQTLVTSLVERYDGDGVSDMPGLRYAVKDWEVMNEPDLNDIDGRLDFYKQDAAAYGELLVKTYSAIRSADSTANVLIAGAAGGNDDFLAFYTNVFNAVPDAKTSFDTGNIHCISNDAQNMNFNVAAYKNMLAAAGITKPIWVTEAEQMDGKTFDENVEHTSTSVRNAIAHGATKFFFTRYDFGDTRTDMSQQYESTEASTDKSIQSYRTIITANQ